MAKKHSNGAAAASKLIPAAGYARRSTDLQERSIPDQKAYVERWAGEHGYRIVRWYIDDAISGTSARGRDDFGRMIETAENGRDFDTILCYDMSRFSRGGTNETGYYLHRMKLAGVEVLFPADAIPEGDEGELIQGVKSWQARQYSVKLARDSIRGLVSSIRERKSAPGGPPPYGYDKQHVAPDGKVLRTLRWLSDGSKQEYGPDGKLVRVIPRDVYVAKAKTDIVRYAPSTPDRVKAIQRMYDMCVKGYGFKWIAERFNEEGVPTMFGYKWNMSNVAQMLRAPVYRGALAYNKRTSGSLFGLDTNGSLRPKKGKRGNFKNRACDWIVVEDVHEPLISQETFEAAQAAIAKRRDAGGKARSVRRTLLSTLLVCKRCGSSFTTVRDRRRKPEFGPPYRHYTCSGYHRYGKTVCGLVRLNGPALDALVLQVIIKTLRGDAKTTKQAVEAFVKAASKPTSANKDAAVKRELEQLNRRIKTTVGLLADPTFEGLDDIRGILTDLQRKRDALVRKLDVEAPRQKPAFTQQQLRDWAQEQFAKLENLTTRTEVDLADRQLIEAFVQRIEFDPDKSRGVIYLYADLQSAFASTRVVGGDDLQNDGHIQSALQRERSLSWFDGTLMKAGTARTNIVNLATALHHDALALVLLRRPGWKSRVFRAIRRWPRDMNLWQQWETLYANPADPAAAETARAFFDAHQAAMLAGARVLWPEEEDLYTLMKMRAEHGRTAFEREKQNSPINPDACEWPEVYFAEPLWFDQWPAGLMAKTLALDPSKGADARRGDYSALVMLGVDRHGVLYVEADLRRRPTPEIVADGVELYRRFRPDVFGIEANQFQDLLAGEFDNAFRRQGLLGARPWPIENHTNKLVRIRRLGPFLAGRRVRFKHDSPGTRLLVEQLRQFPVADHDDGPDALEMAVRLAGDLLAARAGDEVIGTLRT